MALRQKKLDASLRRLDTIFGSPTHQQKGFPSRSDAQRSAATLLAAQMQISYPSALDVVDRWYRERGT